MLFHSTHPTGVRRPSTRRASPTRHFNPRTPVGCDVPVLVLACIGDRISIHAPQWGATSAYHQSPAGALFQSTHPSGVRPPSGDCGRSATADFNPRTPVGCDSYRHHHNKRFHPFQSTHPSGVRPYALRLRFVSRDFNPRTPVGCDGYSVSVPIELRNFNPRTPVGCDRPAFVTMRRTLIFQSTHPCGVRRHHVGRRRRAGPISIHAPQWGATVDIDVLLLDHLISIHAPQWGATEAAEAFLFMPEIFQSTHPSGVRLDSNIAQKFASLSFQSTHPSGVRLNYPGSANGNVVISIHAPQWGATQSAMSLIQEYRFQSTHPSGVRQALVLLLTGETFENFNPRTPVGCDLRPNL